MALDHPIDTDDGAVPAAVRRFIRNRLFEIAGFALFAGTVALGTALASWSPSDPSFNRAIDGDPVNLLGYPGAVISDELMQLLGLASIAVIAVPLAWSARLMMHSGIARPIRSFLAWIACLFLLAGFLALLPPLSSWPLVAGLGGQAGDVLKDACLAALTLGLKNMFAIFIAGGLAGTALTLQDPDFKLQILGPRPLRLCPQRLAPDPIQLGPKLLGAGGFACRHGLRTIS